MQVIIRAFGDVKTYTVLSVYTLNSTLSPPGVDLGVNMRCIFKNAGAGIVVAV